MDSHLQRVGCTPALSSVMGGGFAQQVICKGLPYRSEREEEFLQISVDVRGMGSLERSLESYVKVRAPRHGGGGASCRLEHSRPLQAGHQPRPLLAALPLG